MKFVSLDIGSTTVKAVVEHKGEVIWRDYQRHNTRQAEMVLEFLQRMETECDIGASQTRVYATGSGAGLIAPTFGAKCVQEVVAVAAAVEKLHPKVRFVSEIGSEDMKTIFFTPIKSATALHSDKKSTTRRIIPILSEPRAEGPANGPTANSIERDLTPGLRSSSSGVTGSSKQVYMQSACSGGTGTFVEKTARKLEITSDDLAHMDYDGKSLHKISSKCGIFAEADANTLVKSGVPVDEIIASLFEAVVYQNLATLTKGNKPLPEVLLLGGPNLFFSGLQQAWRYHLKKLWAERRIPIPDGADPENLILIPDDCLTSAPLGQIEVIA